MNDLLAKIWEALSPVLVDSPLTGFLMIAAVFVVFWKHFSGCIKDLKKSINDEHVRIDSSEKNASEIRVDLGRVTQQVGDHEKRMDRRDVEVNVRLNAFDSQLIQLSAASQGRAVSQPARQFNDVEPVCPMNNVIINNETSSLRRDSSQTRAAEISRGNDLPKRGQGRLNDNDERNETC